MYRRINDRCGDESAPHRSGLVASLLRRIPDSNYGPIAGVTTIAAHPEAKRSLHMSTGALAVDNESHVVANVAAAHVLPITAVRVIVDPAARSLPSLWLRCVQTGQSISLH
jgi:adenosylhomocysteine nucleosidase